MLISPLLQNLIYVVARKDKTVPYAKRLYAVSPDILRLADDTALRLLYLHEDREPAWQHHEPIRDADIRGGV
jgi:hypothetical protein